MALTVIEHGYVIPVSTNQLIEDGVVAFEDTRIIYVGPSSKFDRRKFTPTSTINARDARANPVCTENLNPQIMMMKSSKDRA
jgi:hypothetical protein